MSPEYARLLRKMRRQLQRDTLSREKREEEALLNEADLQVLAVESAQRVNYLSGTPSLRSSLEFISSLHTREAAERELITVGRELDPLREREAAAEALDRTASGASVVLQDPEEVKEVALARRMAKLLQPPHSRTVTPWNNSLPDPLWIGRVPAGTGVTDYSLIPVTHPETLEGDAPPWIPSTRSKEVTVPPPTKVLGVTGSWAGHDRLDADARDGKGANRGFSSTRAPIDGSTTGSLARFPHDPIPSHIVSSSRWGTTGGANAREPTPIPSHLLKTLTRAQLTKPRHAAYLMDSHVHHPDPWRRPRRKQKGNFSDPPKSAPPTFNDLKRAAVAMIPDRCLPSSDPIHQGKAPYYAGAGKPPPAFSRLPLDYQWIAEVEEEERKAREEIFWKAAAEAEKPYAGRGTALPGLGGLMDTASTSGGGGGGGLLGSTAHVPAHFLGPQPSPMRRGDALGRPTHATYLNSAGLPAQRSSRSEAFTHQHSLSEAALGATSNSSHPLSLLKGPQGKFNSLRTALVFSTAESALEYEAARANLAARKAMGAKALEQAKITVIRELGETEKRLVEKGVNTGLGNTGRGSLARLIKEEAAMLQRALEPK